MQISLTLFLILAPIAGGFLAGIDRKISARMQNRVGPPLWQPLADVFKLMEKENIVVRRSQNLYITFFCIFVVFTGGIFFAGGDLLLVIFALTLACIFFVLGGYKASSPYSFIGAERELLQMMAYEPALILTALGFYMVCGSFMVHDIMNSGKPVYLYLPGVFISFVICLIVKFRKSPFDLSTSHHAHQEIVKGITTEFSAKTLAIIEIAHWYEYIFLLGIVYLFFHNNILLGLSSVAAVVMFLILIDNVTARVKWQAAVFVIWTITIIFGGGNILVLFLMNMMNKGGN
jgi:formate hydrogenlyase subunit 4